MDYKLDPPDCDEDEAYCSWLEGLNLIEDLPTDTIADILDDLLNGAPLRAETKMHQAIQDEWERYLKDLAEEIADAEYEAYKADCERD
jgi:predicted proteasome-type protease